MSAAFLLVFLWCILAVEFANSIGFPVPGAAVLTVVRNDDILTNATKEREIIDGLSQTPSQPMMFVDTEPVLLQKLLTEAGFALYPNEARELFFVHSYVNKYGLKVFHTKEYMHYEVRETMYNENGVVFADAGFHGPSDDAKSMHNNKGPLLDQYMQDVTDYTKYCATTNESNYIACEQYLEDWKTANEFSDSNGMVPPNSTSCWGELQQNTYIDDQRTTFSSLIPFYVYLYAEANIASNLLEDMLVYIIAQGLHSQTPACNTGGCRVYAHREIWVNVSAIPTEKYNVSMYHWVYSQPETVNQQSSVTTGVSDTVSVGMSGSFGASGASIGFSESYSWTNSYSDTVQLSDFSVIENTSPSTGEGKWRFYQQSPVNILQQPFENFANDWASWYSNDWSPCTVVDGPTLAFNSQQTSNAIKWQAAPDMIDYGAQSFDVVYTVNVMANVDGLWCPDWNGSPTNPCNDKDGTHHCADVYYVRKNPSWTANVIQAMNNLSPSA